MKLFQFISDKCEQCAEFLEKKFPSVIGYIYFVLANLFYTILNMLIGRVATVPPFQLFYLRVLWPTLIFLLINNSRGQAPAAKAPKINKLLIFNGFMYLLGGSCIFYGFQLVPLSEATVIFQTNPAISGVLATILLGEVYDIIQFAITISCTLGVILIAKPAFLFDSYAAEHINEADRAKGIAGLLGGAFIIGLMSVIIKKVVSNVDPNLSAFYIGIVPAIFESLLMLTGSGTKSLDLYEIQIIAIIAMLGFVAQLFYNRAFMFGDAGKVSMMAYSQIIFGYIFDIFLLGTSVDPYSAMGAMCIFSCMFFRIYKTYTEEKKA